MGNVVNLPASRCWDVAARDIEHAARVATAAANKLLAMAEEMEAALDSVNSVVEEIEDPVLREDMRRRTADDRRVLKASIGDLRRKIAR